MNGADHLFAIHPAGVLVLGFMRGFVRESISLLTWLVGLWLAWHFALLALSMARRRAGGARRARMDRAAPPCCSWRCWSAPRSAAIAAHFAQARCRTRRDGPAAGRLFGLMRGAVVIGLLVIGGRAVNLDLEPWWEKHALDAGRRRRSANWLERYAEPAAPELLEQASKTPGS